MAKAKSKGVPYVLTSPVWIGETRLPAGHVVDFEGEPTGVYRGRCKPASALAAAAQGDDGAALAAEKARADNLERELAELKASIPPTPPPPAS